LKYSREKEIARKAVIEAGVLTRAIQSEMVGEGALYKGDKSPVTVADYCGQALICRAINRVFPGDTIVGEEDSAFLTLPENKEILGRLVHYTGQALGKKVSGEEACRWIEIGAGRAGGRFWTLDPVDGTKGFIRGEQYAVALALIEEGEVKVGLLACPNLPSRPGETGGGVCFTAVRGEGAFCFSIDGGEERKISVSRQSDSSEAKMVESVEAGHANHSGQAAAAKALGISKEPVRLDSQAKYGIVARGEAEIYLRMPTPAKPDYRENIWDHAAGVLIVEEAGGRVTDVHGKALDFTKGDKLAENRGVVVTNGLLHEKVLGAISSGVRDAPIMA